MARKRFTLSRATPESPNAFTLIEVLIVVVLLGVLAAIALPHLTNASQDARESTLRDTLRYLRTQLVIYKAQHREIPPGYPGGNLNAAADADSFTQQMTGFTDEAGNVAATASDIFHFGPYLSQLPIMPLNNQRAVWVVTGSTLPTPDDSKPYGWIYNPTMQVIIANKSGTDRAGTPYANY